MPIPAAEPATHTRPWQPTREQQAFIDHVATLSAADQVTAVKAKLVEVNPTWKPGGNVKIVDEKVISYYVYSSGRQLMDLWPFRAFPHLESLSVGGVPGTPSQLKDLSPLAGMQLTKLECGSTAVSDLTPLIGMPLSILDLGDNHVTDKDLVALKGMRLTNLALGRYATNITDLSPLKGMPLTTLRATATAVSDLSPLAELPLTTLYINSNKNLSDLSPLAGLKLTMLDCSKTPVANLAPLTGMPLTTLYCSSTQVADLSPLANMPLTVADFTDTKVTDLSPLATNTTLTNLACGNCAISDLTPLKRARLAVLNVSNTAVSDLSPLEGVPLTGLNILGTEVADLSPLVGMKDTLTVLDCENTLVRDFALLHSLALKELSVSIRLFHPQDEREVRSLFTVTKMGTQGSRTPDAFWASISAARKAAEDYIQSTAQLSGQDLADAVAAQLRQLNKSAQIVFEPELENDQVVRVRVTLPPTAGNLMPLRALRGLKRLTIEGGPRVMDLSLLNSLPLEELNCGEMAVTRDAAVLKEMPTLKTINGRAVGEVTQ